MIVVIVCCRFPYVVEVVVVVACHGRVVASVLGLRLFIRDVYGIDSHNILGTFRTVEIIQFV